MYRIILRKLKKEDVNRIQEICNNELFAKYMPTPYPYTMKDAEDFFKLVKHNEKRKKGLCLAIQLRSGKFIGGFDFWVLDLKKKTSEIGYWLDKKYWSKGYTNEALELGLNYAFNKLKLKSVYATVFEPNKSSIKLLENKGFKKREDLTKVVTKNGVRMKKLYYKLFNKKP